MSDLAATKGHAPVEPGSLPGVDNRKFGKWLFIVNEIMFFAAFIGLFIAYKNTLDMAEFREAFDPLLGFRGIPGHRHAGSDERGRFDVALNAQGFRGREIPAGPTPPVAGVLRVLFVGDSFLVGHELRDEDLVTSLVEAGLRSRGREERRCSTSRASIGAPGRSSSRCEPWVGRSRRIGSCSSSIRRTT